jgi:pyruvate/2-oxoglutarate dehydrogenase complex dihydrolipoamide acyltransferase (E2) component
MTWRRQMEVPVTLPDLGVPTATVSLWFVETGDRVEEGERLLEILAGVATIDISAPASGQLVARRALPTDRVIAGQTLGYIEDNHTAQ